MNQIKSLNSVNREGLKSVQGMQIRMKDMIEELTLITEEMQEIDSGLETPVN